MHGFTQTGSSWDGIARRLPGHEILQPDLPGHGTNASVAADLEGCARFVGDVGGPAAYVGYSMGGRVLLHLALLRPDLVRALVLLGTTAGIDDPEERAARRAADAVLADRLELVGTASFIAEWLAQPLFAGLPAEARGDRSADAAGLAASLRLTGTGSQQPLWDRLPALTMPTLVVAGAHDEKFRALAERLALAIGDHAEVATVPNAGHAAHLEQPDDFVAVVRPWLEGHDDAASPTASSSP